MNAHDCTKHTPGTRTCYVAHGCRCTPCRAEATRWQRHFNHAKRTTGHGLTIPADPVRRHVEHLRAQGMTMLEIARASGVSRGTLRNIKEGRIERTTRKTAAALVAVRQRTEAGHGRVDSRGTARRLQALAALGYDGTDLAPLLGWSPTYVRHLRAPETAAVHAATHDRVAEVYAQLQATPGTNTRARLFAARRKWAPPAAWDDGTGPHGIDNPDAQPVGVRPPARRADGRYAPHLADDLAEAIDTGAALADLEARFLVPWRTIERALQRAGYHDHAARVRPHGIDRERHANARKEAA